MRYVLAFVAAAFMPAAGLAQGRVPNDAYIGTWYCDGGTGPTFEIGRNTYEVGGTKGRISTVERAGNDFLITLTDGYRASLFDVTRNTMMWHSPQSGDTFVCARFRTR